MPVDLPPAYEQTALAAARTIGLEVCGVDMLESKEGPLVMELNSSPGFEGLEQATGVDIAGRIVAHALHISAEAASRSTGITSPGTTTTH